MKNNDKDFLQIYVKAGKTKEIISLYNTFGWNLLEENENQEYDDIVDLSFSRPHFISHKDELQLYQVYMEENMNTSAKAEQYKHAKSTTYALSFGLLGTALLILGILFCCNTLPLLGLVGGVLFSVVGVSLNILVAIFSPKMVKKENIAFEKLHQRLNSELVEICKKAKTLIGDENGKN